MRAGLRAVFLPSKKGEKAMIRLTTQEVENQLKQFYKRQGDKWIAWAFCWGYLVALNHNSLITKAQYEILDKTNQDLLR